VADVNLEAMLRPQHRGSMWSCVRLGYLLVKGWVEFDCLDFLRRDYCGILGMINSRGK